MSGKSKKITKKVILYLVLAVLAIIWIIPIFTLIATSLKHKKDFMSGLSFSFRHRLHGITFPMPLRRDDCLLI